MMVPEEKYQALRYIAIACKILAFLAGGLCTVSALANLVAGIGPASRFGVFLGAVTLVLYGVILFVVLYGAGEFIYVFLDIEENTRMTNYTLSTRGEGQH